MTAMNMLEHQKILLMNSIHDEEMFRKELSKSLKWLDQNEQQKLYLWLRETYWETHQSLIESVYDIKAA